MSKNSDNETEIREMEIATLKSRIDLNNRRAEEIIDRLLNNNMSGTQFDAILDEYKSLIIRIELDRNRLARIKPLAELTHEDRCRLKCNLWNQF